MLINKFKAALNNAMQQKKMCIKFLKLTKQR